METGGEMADKGLPPAGWYPDPEQAGAQRWWDGTQWGESQALSSSGGAEGQSQGEAIAMAATPAEDSKEAGGVKRTPWWQRKRVLLPATAFVFFFLGAAFVVDAEDATLLSAAEQAREEAEQALDAEVARADEAEAAVGELEDSHSQELTELEERLAQAEDERDSAVDSAREELQAEREERLSEAEEEAAEIVSSAEAEAEELLAEAEGRIAALDEREAQLDERAAELDIAEEETAASTFGNGVYVVGSDIEPGTYRTDGGSNCYWARLSGLGGGFEDIIANGLPDGPATVEIRPGDEAFESSGCADWNRSD